jgi:hypothetical protein
MLRDWPVTEQPKIHACSAPPPAAWGEAERPVHDDPAQVSFRLMFPVKEKLHACALCANENVASAGHDPPRPRDERLGAAALIDQARRAGSLSFEDIVRLLSFDPARPSRVPHAQRPRGRARLERRRGSSGSASASTACPVP